MILRNSGGACTANQIPRAGLETVRPVWLGHRRLNASSEADGELEVDAPGGEVVRDGVAPARDVLNPRVVDGVADAEEVEDLERYEAFEGLGAVGTVLLDAARSPRKRSREKPMSTRR